MLLPVHPHALSTAEQMVPTTATCWLFPISWNCLVSEKPCKSEGPTSKPIETKCCNGVKTRPKRNENIRAVLVYVGKTPSTRSAF